MLVLSRRTGERIVVGKNIEITVPGIQGGRVRLGIAAPADVPVHREEVFERICQEHQQAKPRRSRERQESPV